MHTLSIAVLVTAIFIKLSVVAFYIFKTSFVANPQITFRLWSLNPVERGKQKTRKHYFYLVVMCLTTNNVYFELRLLFDLDNIDNTKTAKPYGNG